MTPIRKAVSAAVIAGSLITGGALGAAIATAAVTSGTVVLAASSSPAATNSPAPGTPGARPAGGKFTPNEDPAHEAGESAQREAQEDAGQVPTVP